MKDIAVESEKHVFGLLIIVMIVLKRPCCCL